MMLTELLALVGVLALAPEMIRIVGRGLAALFELLFELRAWWLDLGARWTP